MADPQSDSIKSPIIMKVDGPNEDKDKTDVKDDINIGAQICSPSTLPSRPFLTTNNFLNSNNSWSSKTTLLRPSALGQSMITLKPSKLNPFVKLPADESTSSSNANNNLNNKSVSSNGDAPRFVPLLLNDKDKELIKPLTTIAASQTTHTFVFGQNLQERVVNDPKKKDEDEKPSTSETTTSTNGAANDMLFTSAMKEKPSINDNNNTSKTLSESAREYEEQRAMKRKYEEVEVKTGEEDETNVLHMSCKLFAFDKAVGNWQERGRGNLRLNDQQVTEDDAVFKQSRLVFRTAGVLKVVLNTKIWADMSIEQASPKSIRFTAIDNTSGEVKVFLVMANPEEIRVLYKHLQERLTNEQKRQNVKKPVSTTDEEK